MANPGRIAARLWNAPARWRVPSRWAFKVALFLAVLFLSLYPNPVQFVRQIGRWLAFDDLIDPQFAGVAEANAAIDAILGPDPHPRREAAAVQRFVYDRIPYAYDWDNWGGFDYWPTASEAWARGTEDCDGQAILAASILRSRGHASATIVGNLQHMWVQVGDVGLMGPQSEKALERRPDGSVRVALPSMSTSLAGLAFTLDEFPVARLLAPLIAVLVLAYHPRGRLDEFSVLLAALFAGFALMRLWAVDANATWPRADALDARLAAGCVLVVAAWAGGSLLARCGEAGAPES